MKFNEASAVDQIAYEMRLADYPRSLDRERINELFNGFPPYTPDEVKRNGIAINVNYLEGTRLSHDARSQFAANFLKPGRYFNCKTDMGASHKRTERSAIVTHELAKIMKRSLNYFETFRSKFAMGVLHAVGPSGWDRSDFWCPDAYGIEDVLIPANTLLTMKNLPLFCLYHSYTGPELKRLTRDAEHATKAGWNMTLVNKCLEYIDQETMALSHSNWPEVWSPEKMGERIKGDGGCYAADSVPTIDCFDFYFWDDDEKSEGWKRRVILDAWSTPSNQGGIYSMQRNSKMEFSRNQFLFTSKNRKVAPNWNQIMAFQFADLSAVAPFRYHTVRGMGYLLYAICNLQNRLRCKFNESMFESLMMYFRVKTLDDAERALKVELVDRGFIDETIQFIPATERFQVNANLVQLGLNENQRMITENASSWTQQTNLSQDRTEKTKFQVMAEIQATTALISAGFQQAYRYQEFEYREIFRRFCLPVTRDPDIITFRANCIRRGVPERMLTPEAWDIEPERVLGAGNKTLEMAIAEQLMAYRNLYDPEAQRSILRDVTLAITDDPGRTDTLVPMSPQKVTDAVHDAQLATGTLMLGLPVALKMGVNHIDYVEAMLLSMEVEVGKTNSRGGMTTLEKLEGLHAVNEHVMQHIQIVAQDPEEQQRVTNWMKRLTLLMNQVKAFAQRFAEQQKAQNEGNGEGNGELQAKIEAMVIQAQAKAENTKTAHAQRTAQRQIQFEMQQEQESQRHAAEMQREQERSALELSAEQQSAALELTAEREKQALEIQKAREQAKAKPKESE